MDGDILVVDNNAPLYRGPVLRCLDSASSEYLCERVAQHDGRLVQRGYYVRTSRDRIAELRRRVSDALGRPPTTAVDTDSILDRSSSLILIFSDYKRLDGDREIVRFMLPEYVWWLISPGYEPFPYPLEQTAMEASIQQVLLQRCGDDLPVDVNEDPSVSPYGNVPYDGAYSGSAGPMTLRSYEGVYWEAVGTCTAVEANRGGRRMVP